MGMILDSAGQISVIVAAAIEMPGLANTPAKKRQMLKEAMLCENPAPRMNKAYRGVLAR